MGNPVSLVVLCVYVKDVRFAVGERSQLVLQFVDTHVEIQKPCFREAQRFSFNCVLI